MLLWSCLNLTDIVIWYNMIYECVICDMIWKDIQVTIGLYTHIYIGYCKSFATFDRLSVDNLSLFYQKYNRIIYKLFHKGLVTFNPQLKMNACLENLLNTLFICIHSYIIYGIKHLITLNQIKHVTICFCYHQCFHL